MKNNIFLQFDFQPTDGAHNAPLLFSNPTKIITTAKAREVENCLEQIDHLIEQGYYVAGYFSYEVTYALANEKQPVTNNEMPLIWMGAFEKPTEENTVPTEDFHVGQWEMQVTKEEYKANFDIVMAAIARGETEQINYTIPFHADFSGNGYAYYEQLKAAQQANYCAYLQMGEYEILSASPELFFHKKKNDITVRPMKGTIHRGKTIEEDEQLKQWLQKSEKNKLENELIVQLMKEELEKVTKNGSIYRHHTYHIEKYPTVYQMTSSLTGEIKENLSTMDTLKTLFPCGSISGVPKKPSLQLIQQMENKPREVYCGAIGYITPEKEAIFNVPIRTVWIDNQKGKAHYGAGGAITKKSAVAEEYEEVLTKTNVLRWKRPDFQLLETMAVIDGNIIVEEEHIKRLGQSAAYFNIPVNIEKIQQQLRTIKESYSAGKFRIRLTVSQNGGEHIEVHPFTHATTNKVILANQPVDRDNIFLYHKTTYRSFYEAFLPKNKEILDVILWNKDDEITECTIGNIVVELDGELLTPPISTGILPGTYRQKLLQEGKVKERKILKSDLPNCTNLWLINSVREWVEIELEPTETGYSNSKA